MKTFKHLFTEEEKNDIIDAAMKDANERLELARKMVQPIIKAGEAYRELMNEYRKSIEDNKMTDPKDEDE